MELLVMLFFLAIAVAGALGRTSDSRDYADWQPSEDGRRAPRPGRQVS